jgi:hypothetical protein
MCGSYSLAYYTWLKQGRTYSENESADRAEVTAIYNEVLFGPSYSAVVIPILGTQDLSILNNPLKMLRYAVTELNRTEAKLCYDDTSPVLDALYSAVQSRDSQLVSDYLAKIETGGIPVLNNGQYAIVLFLVTDNNAMHWILFHKTAGGLEYYDPYFGTAKTATEAQLRGTEDIPAHYPSPIGNRTLHSLNSCLLLP